MERPGVIFGALLALAALWTFPAVLAGPELLVGRNFDAPGTLWSLAATPRLLRGGLMDTSTSWPVGGDYLRFDSYTVLPIAWLLQWMDAARLHGWMQVFGVAMSGTAVAMFCREVGARGLWLLGGGVIFAFSGLAATVLLEGHVYHLLNPWLPLFGLMWWRAMSGGGSAKQGALAGLLYVLVAATTAYQGVSAAILALVLLGYGLKRHGPLAIWRPALAAALVVAAGAAPLVWLVSQGGDGNGESVVIFGNLSALSVGGSEVDRRHHSYVLALSGLALGLVALVPSVRTKGSPTRQLFGLFVLALAISLGLPASSPDATPLGLITPLLWMGLGELLRFPVRLFWVGLLALAGLASLAGTLLEQRIGGRARWVVAALVVEAFVLHHLPLRQRTQIASAPQVYAQAQGPVLDLFPMGGQGPMEQEMWFNAAACVAQARHGHVSGEHCTSTDPRSSPRYRVSREIERALMEGRPEQVGAVMRSMGFVHLAWHADLYSAGDRARMEPVLAQLGQPQISTDGGEYLAFYSVPAGNPMNMVGAYQGLLDRAPSRYGTGLSQGSVLIESMGSPLAQSVRIDGGAMIPLQMRDQGDVGMGGVRKLLLELPQSSALELQTLNSRNEVIWAGPVALSGSPDRLTLNGGIPQPAVPLSIGPSVRFWVGQATALGLGLYGLVLLGLWGGRRWGSEGRGSLDSSVDKGDSDISK